MISSRIRIYTFILVGFGAFLHAAGPVRRPAPVKVKNYHFSFELDNPFLYNALAIGPDSGRLIKPAPHMQYLFCHGVGGNACNAQYYQAYGALPADVYSFDFCDYCDGKFDRTKTAMGQAADIAVLRAQCAQLNTAQTRLVLCGVSRGASTIINFVGKEKPKNIAALILESPFAHMDDVLNNFTGSSILPTNFIMGRIYPAYNRQGEQPIDYIEAINKNIPIALICSKTDALVPYTSTMKLYDRLIAQGRKNVQILILPEGAHANLCDGPEYQRFVKNFLKRYKLILG